MLEVVKAWSRTETAAVNSVSDSTRREDVQQLTKRVHTMGMEVAKKDDLALVLGRNAWSTCVLQDGRAEAELLCRR